MSKDIELKDNLYYADLIYAVKKLGDIEHIEDSETEERIKLRLQPVYDEDQAKENELIGEELSDFELDLFLVIRVIGKKAGDSFRSIEDICKYPEVIQEVLLELENKNMENFLLNHLKDTIKSMGLEDAFHLGEYAEQRVCLFKGNNLWEVYVAERGTIFDKSVFEDCFDACIEVINQLADSKQMYEKYKKDFSLVKKLIPTPSNNK